jgi:subtilisin family serine protease
MKKKLLFALLFLSLNANAQEKNNDKSKIIVEKTETASKLSISTRFLYEEAKQNKTNNPTQVCLESLVRTTLLFEENCQNYDQSILMDVSTITKNIKTAFVKIKNLPELENYSCLKYADVGEKIKLEVNNARTVTNTNALHAGTGLSQSYTGNGVVIGIIDGGFDYTHSNFKDINGTLRISRVWERSNTSGNPPSTLGFNYGSEFVGSTAILSKQYDMNTISHGTHVAGIATGTGTGNLALLKGMAPNSEIVLVSGVENGYIDAVNYIKNYANSINKPVVINMSFGEGLGPHDGTTLQEIAINSLSSNPGFVLVAAAGNDGESQKHVRTVFNGSQTKNIVTNKNIFENNENSTIDIWGANQGVNSAFQITIGVYNHTTQQYDSNPLQFTVNGNLQFQNPYILTDTDPTNSDTWTISLFSEINPQNNRPTIRISTTSTNNDDDDYLKIAIQSTDNIINSWCNNCFFKNLENASFVEGDDFYTIFSPGNASGVIAVGSFNVSEVENQTIGELSNFSSKGPRADLSIKPDITAPGNRIVSSLNSFDTTYQTGGSNFNDVTNTFATHSYGKMEGTSMAAPVVTGIIALWLQANPTLTIANIKTILANTSITDTPVTAPFNFYGTQSNTVPNIKWGAGKINALAGMQYINQFLNIDAIENSTKTVIYPNPVSNELTIFSSEILADYEIFNALGQLIKQGKLQDNLNHYELNLASLEKGIYVLNLKTEKITKSFKIIKE